MILELDTDQVAEIIDEWCEREHGWSINVLRWQVKDKELKGATILCSPEDQLQS